MNYNDKLKLAKEALDSGSYDKETIEYIFPELAESEDERIRKEIIDFIYDKTDTYELREKSNSWLAWLEKQGSQNLANSAKTCKDEQKPADTEKGAKGNDREIPNSAWSEEDAINLVNTIRALQSLGMIQEADHRYDNLIAWLKSLKERYTWKPSDEQMLAINTAINVVGKGTINGKYLVELHEQLLKLREK